MKKATLNVEGSFFSLLFIELFPVQIVRPPTREVVEVGGRLPYSPGRSGYALRPGARIRPTASGRFVLPKNYIESPI